MLVFDIETNGLLHDVSAIHCIATLQTETQESCVFNHRGDQSGTVEDGIHQIMEAETVAGHNIIGYDLPVIRKLYNRVRDNDGTIDTLVLSRLYHPNLIEIDKKDNGNTCHYNYMEGTHSKPTDTD